MPVRDPSVVSFSAKQNSTDTGNSPALVCSGKPKANNFGFSWGSLRLKLQGFCFSNHDSETVRLSVKIFIEIIYTLNKCLTTYNYILQLRVSRFGFVFCIIFIYLLFFFLRNDSVYRRNINYLYNKRDH